MKYKELAALGEEEKNAKISELKKELMKLRAQAATGTSPKNSGRISEIRKDIARLLSALSKRSA